MSSRFFSTGDSASESELEVSSGDEQETLTVEDRDKDRMATNRFVYSSSSDEDEVKRVVVSDFDKKFASLRKIVKELNNHLKIGDWAALSKDVDGLQKAMDKSRAALAQHSTSSLLNCEDWQPNSAQQLSATYGRTFLPAFVLDAIYEMDEASKRAFADKEAKKKMSGPNAKALNAMKQRIRKFAALLGGQYERYSEDAKLRSAMRESEGLDQVKAEEEKKNIETASSLKSSGSKKKKKIEVESEEQSEHYEDEENGSDYDEDDDGKAINKEKKKKVTMKVPKNNKKKAISDEEDEDEDGEDEDEEDEDEEDDDETDLRSKFTKKKSVKQKSAVMDEDDDNEEDDQDEDNVESDESDADSVDLSSGGNSAMFTRDFWVKKQASSEDSSSDDDDQQARDTRRRLAKLARKKAQQEASVEQALKAGADSSHRQQADMTPEAVIKKLKELIALRGKRGTDKLAMISDLKLLATKATEPAARLKVHTILASALFDVTLNRNTHVTAPLWKECHDQVVEILGLLSAYPNVRLSEDEKVEERFEDDEQDEEAATQFDTSAALHSQFALQAAEEKARLEGEEDLTVQQGKVQYVMGNLYAFIQLLSMEYRKAMQAIDWHSEEYVQRLRDEAVLESLIARAQEYYHGIGKTNLEASVAILRLELVYYQYKPEYDALKTSVASSTVAELSISSTQLPNKQEHVGHKGKTSADEEKQTLSSSLTQPSHFFDSITPNISLASSAAPLKQGLAGQLSTFLYKHGTDQSRVRALLMHVYHLALHNNYHAARELLLMSHIAETVQHADIKTQVLFNRALAQLGLASFRVGEFRATLDLLSDLVQSNRLRELIAQGSSYRWNQSDAQQLEMEKKRQLPVHMHMSQDTIEAAHLISAMLEEVPNLAQFGASTKRRVLSKAFRRTLEGHQRQAFTGPPEHTRDFIMAATKAMRAGDWERCHLWLKELRLWQTLDPEVSKFAQQKLMVKIKEETLRTYLLSYAQHFTTISMESLTLSFALDQTAVRQVSARLIANNQLSGQWDAVNNVIKVADVGVNHNSRLQRVALAFADKNTTFMEQNERMFDSRQGFQSGVFRGKDRNDREGGKDRNDREGAFQSVRGRGQRTRGGNRGGGGGGGGRGRGRGRGGRGAY